MNITPSEELLTIGLIEAKAKIGTLEAQRDHYAAVATETQERLRRFEEQEESLGLLEDQLRLVTRFERDYSGRVIGLRDSICAFDIPTHAIWPEVEIAFEDDGCSVMYTLESVTKAVVYHMEIVGIL